MTMQLRQAINDYKPIQRIIEPTKQIQGGSRGRVSPVTDYKPVTFVKGAGTNTRTVARPNQGQN